VRNVNCACVCVRLCGVAVGRHANTAKGNKPGEIRMKHDKREDKKEERKILILF